ncbi:MAG: UvrD-helicase domain-containing protein [Verrucomicrobia bacterium]|nr:UvrD-helicase domain-containing protein [Verrucomicrobiota bacterium]
MKTNITFISASAGSGKTHRITEVIEDRLSKGLCRPGGLIATTYTVKAAQELRERVRRRLYNSGHPPLAERLHESLMGTVHGVCGQLLERFAFEAGISPRIEILAEDDAASLLIQAIETAVDFGTLNRLQRLADILGQKDSRTFEYFWKRQVRALLDAARANDFPPVSLADMGRQSIDELLAFLPAPTTDNLDDQLAAAITSAMDRISKNGDETGVAADYLELLQDALRALEAHRLPWSDWIKLSKKQPGKKSQADAAAVTALANRVETHPQLHEHIRDYTMLLFSVAQLSLTEFQRLKEERGLLDFSDLEQRAFQLLRDQAQVRDTLSHELDLLVVDEFQDTSPLQLALFMQLATLARETVWVGDVKQAIYGFRNSDPDLIKAVVEQVRKVGSQFNKGNGALKKLTNDQRAITLADGIVQLLSRGDKLVVQDRLNRERLRPIEPRDMAVLCRTNLAAATIAAKLTQRGYTVTLSQSGLLATPEARLALACLRRLADPTDSLASAEIVALEAAQQPEEWLESRLKYVAKARQETERIRSDRWGLEGDFVHPAIVALEQARARLNVLSPSEALDVALHDGGVFATVSAWGSTVTRASQRRANLESLRAIAVKYEQAAAKNHTPATIASFLNWCDFLADSEADLKATDAQVNAIFVSTYHQAKGLEWPIVICTDLNTEPRPRLWEVTVIPADPTKSFDLNQPLANRRLRFWPWPFGQQETGIPLHTNVEAGDIGLAALRKAVEEELRLLYVGLTRARDLLVLVREKDQPAPWLEGLQAQWLQPGRDQLVLPDKTTLSLQTLQLTPPAEIASAKMDSTYAWFPAPLTPTPKLSARLTPSRQSQLLGSRIGRIIEIGPRLPFSGALEEADLGDALHAIFAAEFVNPGHARRLETIQRILLGYELSDHLKGEDVLQTVDQFRASLEQQFHPKQVLVEIPIATTNESDQRIEGFIDMLVETSNGWILIDHKSFPGKRSEWPTEAVSYSGQLALYREALKKLKLPVASVWIHFAVGGGFVEVLLDGNV